MNSEHEGGPWLAVDTRWFGQHGIGRFAQEVTRRIHGWQPLALPSQLGLLHPLEPLVISYALTRVASGINCYFSPGFNPPLWSPIPFVFTVHDLNQTLVPESSSLIKRAYYHSIIRPACQKAAQVLTVSEFSKNAIVEWANVPESRVINVGNGVDAHFSANGEKWTPGYPYFLNIGNRKPHKNIHRLFEAFRRSRSCGQAKLVLSGDSTGELASFIDRHKLNDSVIFAGQITEEQLPRYYRGASALIFPSIYEGFGLPVLEAMACGTPVITSNVAALPEISGDAAVLIDPYSVEELANAMDRVLESATLQQVMRSKGIEQAKRYSWDDVATKVRSVLGKYTN